MDDKQAQLLDRISLPAWRLLNDETRAGRTPILPTNAPAWLNLDDWRGWPVLSIGDGELFVIAVWSARRGALSRLIAGAQGAGLSPVIVCPMGRQMPAILAHWGWQKRIADDPGGGVVEEWRPAPVAERAAG